jgi:signal transduction histidine kinase
MKKRSIFSKLFFSIFLVSSFCVLTFGVLVYTNQKKALIQRTMDQLKSVNILKKEMVERRLREDEEFIWHFVRKVMLYDTASYFSPEKEFHVHKDFLKDFCHDFGHIDVLLLDKDENLVDSLFEQNGHLSTKDTSNTSMYYFTRIFAVDNSEYKIALVTSTRYLEYLLFENTGMGSTGESYLVDENHKMITKSRFFPEISPDQILVNTAAVDSALQHKTGTVRTNDYRDIEVLSAFAPIEHKGLDWALMSEMDVSEAMSSVQQMGFIISYFSVFVLLAAFMVAYYLSKLVSNPLKLVSNGLEELSLGEIPERMQPPFYRNEESKMKLAMNRLIDSFDSIRKFASEIGKGNLQADYIPLGEKDELGKSLVNMREQLKSYQTQEKMQNRQKTMSLLEGQENERKRIARDLHDGLGQWLTGIKLKIASVTMQEDQREELKALVSETIEETRRITNNLMPNTLVDFGLDAALRQLVGNVQKGSPLLITYSYEKKEGSDIPFEVMLTLYRIAQEAINNIMKHAQAQNVLLQVSEKEHLITLVVEDDGRGLPDKVKKGGNGLGNMEERANLINGSFSLKNKEKGTKLKVEVPI